MILGPLSGIKLLDGSVTFSLVVACVLAFMLVALRTPDMACTFSIYAARLCVASDNRRLNAIVEDGMGVSLCPLTAI